MGNKKNLFFEFSVFGSVGVTMEVFFTAFMDLPKAGNLRLLGYSYPWIFPVYGSAAFLFRLLYPCISKFTFLSRGLIYVFLFFFFEYLSGWIFRLALGKCPWEENYIVSSWNINGLIRLDYFPAWFLAGLIFELFYLNLNLKRQCSS